MTTRRNTLTEMVPAEKAIYNAMQEVENLPPNVGLTSAIMHLIEAKELVSDFIDNKPIKPRMPKVGEIVLFTANPDDSIAKSNHNTEAIPAIITRVWSEVCVNVKIVPDCGPMQDRTSVVHESANPAGYHFKYIQ